MRTPKLLIQTGDQCVRNVFSCHKEQKNLFHKPHQTDIWLME